MDTAGIATTATPRLRPHTVAMLTQLREVTHALLLSGTSAAVAEEAALWLARWRLCPNGSGEDGCPACQRVNRRTHTDLMWVQPEGLEIAVAQSDEIVRQLGQKPFEADAQVVVIEDADTLSSTNPLAGNALLKVLEEPPGPALFVLLASRPSRLLPTLRSRVIHVPLPALDDATMHATLSEHGITDGALAHLGLDLASLVRIAGGDPQRALDIAAGGGGLARYRVAGSTGLQLCTGTISPDAAAAALAQRCDEVGAVVEQQARVELEREADLMPPKEGGRFRTSTAPDGLEARVRRRVRRARTIEQRAVLAELAWLYRDLMAVSTGRPDVIRALDRQQELVSLAGTPAAHRAVAALDAIEEAALRLGMNVDEAVALQALCGELASLADGRVRARRTIGAPSRTPQGVDLALG